MNMLKIMIADDEPLYRQYLIQSFDWEKYDFAVCCEAQNGVDALEKAREFHPAIAFVDINMPLMNGIELTRKLRELEPKTRVILLTGYSEFEYMRTAIQLEVSDYILKPFSEDELLQTLLRVREEIMQNNQDEAVKIKDTEMVRQQLLNALISNEYWMPDEELKIQLERIGLCTGAAWYQIAVMEIDNFYQKWSGTRDAALCQYGLSNILNELMTFPSGRHDVFPGPEGRLVSLFQFQDLSAGENFVYEQYLRLQKIVKKYLHFTVSVGIGERRDDLKQIHQSYQEALRVLQNKWSMGEERIMRYRSLADGRLRVAFYSAELNEKLLHGIRVRDLSETETALDAIFQFIREKHLSEDYALTIFIGVISLCLSVVTEQGTTVEEMFGDGFEPYEKIRHMESLEVIHDWFLSFFQTLMDRMKQKRLTKTRALVMQAREHIQVHLQDSMLNLESIANALYVSPSYLRKIFKKELNINISDYIQQTRLQKAKDLLSSCTGISISAVAEMTGYHDVSYFSKCFKKATGITPSEYEVARTERK